MIQAVFVPTQSEFFFVDAGFDLDLKFGCLKPTPVGDGNNSDFIILCLFFFFFFKTHPKTSKATVRSNLKPL